MAVDIEQAPEPMPEYHAVDPSIVGTHEESSAPKRRGRPPKDPNAPPRPPGRPRKSGKPSLENGIGSMLIMSNIVFGFMPEPWNGDAFTDDEIGLLAAALNAYAQDHAKVYKYLSSVVGGGSSSTIQLMLAIGMVANRRLQNHGITIADLMGMGSQKASVSESAGQYPTE
jgi:hypothetical protein